MSSTGHRTAHSACVDKSRRLPGVIGQTGMSVQARRMHSCNHTNISPGHRASPRVDSGGHRARRGAEFHPVARIRLAHQAVQRVRVVQERRC
eukprot:2966486-Rhodomonas_salina.4